jgi:hypothetical protein
MSFKYGTSISKILKPSEPFLKIVTLDLADLIVLNQNIKMVGHARNCRSSRKVLILSHFLLSSAMESMESSDIELLRFHQNRPIRGRNDSGKIDRFSRLIISGKREIKAWRLVQVRRCNKSESLSHLCFAFWFKIPAERRNPTPPPFTSPRKPNSVDRHPPSIEWLSKYFDFPPNRTLIRFLQKWW